MMMPLHGSERIWKKSCQKRIPRIKRISEKTKTIAELADYVRSDLPVQEIIDNFQYLIQKLDYTNRVAAITKAIERLNDGCTYDYVAAGLREWYGIDISSQELALLLYGAEGLLPREIRYKRQLAKQEKKANQTE